MRMCVWVGVWVAIVRGRVGLMRIGLMLRLWWWDVLIIWVSGLCRVFLDDANWCQG